MGDVDGGRLEPRDRRDGLLLLVGEYRSRVRQRHQLHQRLLHPGRGLHRADGGAHIPEILRLGADRYAQRRVHSRSDRQRARLHGRLSESHHEDRDQLFYRQSGRGRPARPADLPAALGPLGRHGDVVPRIKTLQGRAVSAGEPLDRLGYIKRAAARVRVIFNR